VPPPADPSCPSHEGTVVDANPAAGRLLVVARPDAPVVCKLITLGGGVTYLELSADLTGDQGLRHVIGRDVTLRIRAEQQLHASEQRF